MAFGLCLFLYGISGCMGTRYPERHIFIFRRGQISLPKIPTDELQHWRSADGQFYTLCGY